EARRARSASPRRRRSEAMNHAILALGLIFADGGENGTTYTLVPTDVRIQLDGEWQIVQMMKDGRDYCSPDELRRSRMTVVFKGDTITFKIRGRGQPEPFRLNPNGKPEELDLGDSKGIYHFEKDELRIALSPDGRPKDFSSRGFTMVYTLKR